MKKVFSLILLSIFTFGAFAQSKKSMHHAMRDCVMMENGKMKVMRGGVKTGMAIPMPLKNGTVINSDGTVKTADGQTVTLNNGDCVMIGDGKIVRRKGKMKGGSKM